MPKVTIIPGDDYVIVDGDARKVDCATLRAQGLRAVQWDGAAGAVEPKQGAQYAIAALTDYQAYVDAHAVAPAETIAPATPTTQEQLDALSARIAALELKVV